MRRKKGQTTVNAGNAAVFILLLTMMLVVYILLLPPSEREDLLRGNETDDNGDDDDLDDAETLLLEENPGRLDFLSSREYEHDIPSFYLYKTTNSEEIRNVNPFMVRNAVFDKKGHNLSFRITDLENTKNVLLSFSADKHVGILTIILNGQKIFESDISSYTVEPVSLPHEFLKQENVLEFSVSEVGWRFWKTNEYQLGGVRIIGDVTDTSRQESRNTFYVTGIEKNNAERTLIKYSPECSPNSVGNLGVYVNNQNVFSGVPDCGVLNTHEFSPGLLFDGSNSVIFKTEEGSYLIDLIQIKTKLRDSPYVVYYFELNSSQYDDVLDDKIDINLTFEFVEKGNLKEAKLIINGHETGIYTKERIYSRIIDAYIQRENNAIKIVPKETLDIVNLQVKIED